LKNPSQLTIIENKNRKYVEESLDKENGNVYYLCRGKIINSFSYEALHNQ